MTDYSQIGKEVILAASEAQLELMKKSDRVIYDSIYGATSSLYEIAARRIGEKDLGDKFTNPKPSLEVLVKRMSSYNSLLTGVIASLERGNRSFAELLERAQRKLFYIEDLGYFDPHFYGLYKGEELEKAKKHIREQTLKTGDANLGTHEEVELFGFYDDNRKWRTKWRAKFLSTIGNLSPREAEYAIFANLALGDKEHAQKIANDLFKHYFNGKDFGCFSVNRKTFEEVLPICRATDMAGDERGMELFHKIKDDITETAFSSKDYVQRSAFPILAYALDYFGDESAQRVKEAIADFPEVKVKKILKKPDFEGPLYGSFSVNKDLIEFGLALIGLEKDKPNYYYTP